MLKWSRRISQKVKNTQLKAHQAVMEKQIFKNCTTSKQIFIQHEKNISLYKNLHAPEAAYSGLERQSAFNICSEQIPQEQLQLINKNVKLCQKNSQKVPQIQEAYGVLVQTYTLSQ
ncbi:hypothetical protein ABPG72_015303 [Tetrahymena utriculariae]